VYRITPFPTKSSFAEWGITYAKVYRITPFPTKSSFAEWGITICLQKVLTIG
jgi:hypothetical protein